MKKLSSALAIACSILGLAVSHGATTDPVGAMALKLPAHLGEGRSTLSLINLSFVKPVDYTGSLSNVLGDTVTVSSSSWTASEFEMFDPDGLSKYYIEISSGSYEGLIIPIVSNEASSLTLAEDVSYLVPEVDLPITFNIRQYFTLGEIFTADNSEPGLLSGGNSSQSDVLYIINQFGNFERFFYQTAPVFAGGSGWRKGGDGLTDYSGKTIPSNTILLSRNGPDSAPEVSVIVSGAVKVSNQRTPIYSGFNLVGFSFPLDTTLATSGLDPNLLLSGGTASSSDVLYVINAGTGDFDRYYYQEAPTFAGGNGWRLAGDGVTDQGSKIISAGTGLLVLRRDVQGFDWNSPLPF